MHQEHLRQGVQAKRSVAPQGFGLLPTAKSQLHHFQSQLHNHRVGFRHHLAWQICALWALKRYRQLLKKQHLLILIATLNWVSCCCLRFVVQCYCSKIEVLNSCCWGHAYNRIWCVVVNAEVRKQLGLLDIQLRRIMCNLKRRFHLRALVKDMSCTRSPFLEISFHELDGSRR